MRLSWNEVRARAAQFVNEWKDATDEIRETHSFYNAFFRIFGDRRRQTEIRSTMLRVTRRRRRS